MHREAVDSSQFDEVGYDPLMQVMEVKFRNNGRIVRYSGVTRAEWEGLGAAESKGRYFNAVIRGLKGFDYVDTGGE